MSMIHRSKIRREVRVASLAHQTNNEPVDINEPEVVEETQAEYKKSDIVLMRKDNLVSLAIEKGISGANEMSGNELKKALIDVLGL